MTVMLPTTTGMGLGALQMEQRVEEARLRGNPQPEHSHSVEEATGMLRGEGAGAEVEVSGEVVGEVWLTVRGAAVRGWARVGD